MKIIKFKKDKELIKITYKNFWGITRTRDIFKPSYLSQWRFLDNNKFVQIKEPVEKFLEMGIDEYKVNK